MENGAFNRSVKNDPWDRERIIFSENCRVAINFLFITQLVSSEAHKISVIASPESFSRRSKSLLKQGIFKKCRKSTEDMWQCGMFRVLPKNHHQRGKEGISVQTKKESSGTYLGDIPLYACLFKGCLESISPK